MRRPLHFHSVMFWNDFKPGQTSLHTYKQIWKRHVSEPRQPEVKLIPHHGCCCCSSWPGLLEPQYWPLCGGLCEFSYWVIIRLRELVYRTDWWIILRLRQHKNIQSRSLVGCFRCFEFLCHCFLHCWSHRTHTDVPSCIWRVKCEQRHPPLFFLLLLLFVKETFTVPFDVCASECLTWNTTSHFHHHVCMQQLYGQLHVHRDQIMSPPPYLLEQKGNAKIN